MWMKAYVINFNAITNFCGKGFFLELSFFHKFSQIIGNKGKERILKRVFQENKGRQIFRKTNIFYPLIRTLTRNVCFSENLACFIFLKHPFWDSPFCLITDDFVVTFFYLWGIWPEFWKSNRLSSGCWPISRNWPTQTISKLVVCLLIASLTHSRKMFFWLILQRVIKLDDKSIKLVVYTPWSTLNYWTLLESHRPLC